MSLQGVLVLLVSLGVYAYIRASHLEETYNEAANIANLIEQLDNLLIS